MKNKKTNAKFKILFLAIISCALFGWAEKSWADTHNAASCEQADVQSAINAAVSGDTVLVPVGNCTWSILNSWTPAVQIVSTKKITLQGSGIGATAITAGTGEGNLLHLRESGSRVTGFTFKDGNLKANGKNWRIDHNRFEYACAGGGTIYEAILIISDTGLGYTENVKGVIDHNQFHNMRIVASGGPSMMANEAWARPLGLGTDEAVYVEDNDFTYATCTTIQAMDANYGGAYVFRYNNIQDASIMAHAIQGTNRATRKWEVYGNRFYAVGQAWTPGFIRAGTGVWFDNELVGPIGYGNGEWSSPNVLMDEQRSCAALGNGGKCDGTSAWDGNEEGQGGYPCRDQIGRSIDNPEWVSTLGGEGAYTQALEPAYAWNNFVYPTEEDRIGKINGIAFELSVKSDICAEAKAHLISGRDFVNNGITSKPGYTSYTYPHPLTIEGDIVPPSAPSGLSVN